VLLLDNCSAHPDEEELTSADSKVIARFLPLNDDSTPIIDFVKGINMMTVSKMHHLSGNNSR